MMNVHYDPEADAFAVRFAPKGAYAESEEVAPGVILDFDVDGQVIGIEVLGVRKRMSAPVLSGAPLSEEKSAAE